ncbi:MAG: hypothetical protein KIT14_07125 [bacterium]|nr:hypothetical protein [bacterium]
MPPQTSARSGGQAARRTAVAVGLLVTAGLVPLHLAYVRHAGALWRDEVNSVNVAGLPSLAEVVAHSHLDSFPVAWVLVLHGWIRAGLGETDADLRRIGLVVGAAILAAVWWSGRRLGLAAPLVTLLLLASSPNTIVYGDEVRGYGLGVVGIVWCLGALWAFVETPGWRRFAVAQAAAILAVQAYFGNCFLLLALCLGAAAVCLRRRTWRLAGAVLGLGAAAAASMLVNLPSVRYAAELAPVEQGTYGASWFVTMLAGALAPEVPVLAWAWATAGLLGVAGCLLAVEARDRERALYVGVAVVAALAGYLAYLSYISVRTQFWYYLPLMAVTALGCDVGTALLARRVPRGELIRAGAVVLVALLAARDVAAATRVRMTNLDLVAEAIAREARPNDLVVVLPWYCGITFQRYYRGAAPWITLPDFPEHRFHLHAEVKAKLRLGNAAVAPELARVERTLRDGGRVWLVGIPPAPPPGTEPATLPPAPEGPEGWRAAPYLDTWELMLGALLQAHSVDAWKLGLPDAGPLNYWENLPLLRVEGWRS